MGTDTVPDTGTDAPVEVRPATVFEDVATLVGPKKSPTANVCFCLSYRLRNKEHTALRGEARGEKMRELCAEDPPPGVVAYRDDEPVGWAAVHPRAATSFAVNRKIPHVDDLDVWSLWCVRVRPGHRKQGITGKLIEGAVEHARVNGAPAVETYPVDNHGEKVEMTMAYVGTRHMFEKAGFTVAAETDAVLDGFPRVLMRRDMRS
ncbi:MAG TPA: GNAT family N-acetyltransferase [Candidatus Corynebacterium avicola]|uniref:GNAT family N-acetyltransferase n=1 Tax=Candidatus Corynebacterium avicola TaxID=2838527 RepID=A0A9D1UKV0_9CORY|nr:GNAT family N-acetyltransferase [Candidatus Corynebacterium avicola]